MGRNIGLLAVSVLAAAYIAGGCGGTGSDPTIERYFRLLAEAGVEFDERIEELRFEPNLDSDEPPLDQVNQFFNEFVLANNEYVEALVEIDAPSEVAKEHAELVAAVTDLTDIVTRSLGRWDTVSEAQQFIEQGFDESDPELRDASQRFEAACAALREAAMSNNISSLVEC